MLLSNVCGMMKQVLSAGRRLLCTTAKCKSTSPLILSFRYGKVPGCLHQPLITVRRQIKFQPSQKKGGKLSPQYHWDRVPPNFSLIYESHLKNWIYLYNSSVAAVGTLSCFIIGFALREHWEMLAVDDVQSFAVITGIIVLLIGFTTLATRKFITRIYHDLESGQFIAVRRTCLGRLRQIKYSVEDIKFHPKSDADVENGAQVKIKGKTCHLTATDFVSPMYYNMHLGDKTGSGDITKTYVGGPKF